MIDADAFKQALGRWATGVTVVTARGRDGAPVGFTATSFASVSLDPTLVLFCLGRDSTGFDEFGAAEHYAVHLLAAGQAALSNGFARSGGDKFAGVPHTPGENGAPLLEGCLAAVECRRREVFDGGDHAIFLAEVTAVHIAEGEPLCYFRGAYRALALPPAGPD